MRIISGQFKKAKLFIPQNKNTRPLKDMTKESIFNSLIHSKKCLFEFKKKKILDLYSGSGSFGLECLSRYADQVVFVENNKETLKILKKNIQKLNLETKASIVENSVLNYLTKIHSLNYKFDLIFFDPPYKDKNVVGLISNIIKLKILRKNGIIIIHRNKNLNENYPSNFKILDTKIYGVSKIIYGNLIF